MALSEIVTSVSALLQTLRNVKQLSNESVNNTQTLSSNLVVGITQLSEQAQLLDDQYESIANAIATVKKSAIPLIQALNANDTSKVTSCIAELASTVRELNNLIKAHNPSEPKPDKKSASGDKSTPSVPISEIKSLIANDIRQTICDLDQSYKKGDNSKMTQLISILVEQCGLVCSYTGEDLEESGLSQSLKEVHTVCFVDNNQNSVQDALKTVHRTLKQILEKKEKEKKSKEKKTPLENEMKYLSENTAGGDPTALFTIEKELGKGASGTVYHAISKSDNSVYAIKKVPLSAKTLSATIKEIKFMRGIQNPNTLKYYTCYHKENDVWIVMEICDIGSVLDILNKTENGLEEKAIVAITAQVLRGLDYLHSQAKTIHRDIKSANLLVNSKAEVKIADYGAAAEADVIRTTFIGSSYWMAPETIDQRGYNSKADIWSLGITLLEMAEKDPPYFKLEPLEVVRAIVQQAPPSLKNPSEWSTNFVDVVKLCLNKDPKKRGSAATLLQHPWTQTADQNNLVELVEKFLRDKKIIGTHNTGNPKLNLSASTPPPRPKNSGNSKSLENLTSPPTESKKRSVGSNQSKLKNSEEKSKQIKRKNDSDNS